MSLILVVNADDFGLSQAINLGIVEAHDRGIVTSASLMANGPAVWQAVELARTRPTLDLGVHLTLVEERPLLPALQLPSLVDETGRLPASAARFAWRYQRGQILDAEVRAELRAQLQWLADTGLPFSHVDSHQHVHALPGVRRVVIELAREFGIARIRRPLPRVQPWMWRYPARYRRVLEMLALGAVCRLGSWQGLQQPLRFEGFHSGGRLDHKALQELLDHLPASGACELMCHPGRAAIDSLHAHWQYRWEEELSALTAPGLKQRLTARGIQLAGQNSNYPNGS